MSKPAPAPDLLAACRIALDWFSRHDAEAQIVFDGERTDVASVLLRAIKAEIGEIEQEPLYPCENCNAELAEELEGMWKHGTDVGGGESPGTPSAPTIYWATRKVECPFCEYVFQMDASSD